MKLNRTAAAKAGLSVLALAGLLLAAQQLDLLGIGALTVGAVAAVATSFRTGAQRVGTLEEGRPDPVVSPRLVSIEALLREHIDTERELLRTADETERAAVRAVNSFEDVGREVERLRATAERHDERVHELLAGLRELAWEQQRSDREHAQTLHRQTEALLALHAGLGSQIPAGATMPEFGGWALSADVAAFLVREIQARAQGAVVVELGSGTSSVVMGLAAKVSGGRIHSLEHEREYASRSRALVSRFGVSSVVTIHDAPLRPVAIDGQSYDWYDVPDDLPDVDILFVDGPPGTTRDLARYPAVRQLAARLRPGAMVVLDDAKRPDERRITEMWAAELGVEAEFLDHQKGTAVLRLPG